MSKSNAGQAARAEAWYHLWPVLMELGIDDKYPDMISQDAAEKFIRGLAAERDAEIRTGQKYREMGSSIFAEINSLAEQSLGHPIETGHTAVYAVELLVAENARLAAELSGLETYANQVTADRARYLLALQAIAKSDYLDRLGFAHFALVKSREALGLPGEGGGV